MRRRISIRGCVRPSVRRMVRPQLFWKVKSRHTRRILCRVSGLVSPWILFLIPSTTFLIVVCLFFIDGQESNFTVLLTKEWPGSDSSYNVFLLIKRGSDATQWAGMGTKSGGQRQASAIMLICLWAMSGGGKTPCKGKKTPNFIFLMKNKKINLWPKAGGWLFEVCFSAN